MPWIHREHACAKPDPIPSGYGAGSVWRCGDITADSCGRYWQLQLDETDHLTWVEIDTYPPA